MRVVVTGYDYMLNLNFLVELLVNFGALHRETLRNRFVSCLMPVKVFDLPNKSPTSPQIIETVAVDLDLMLSMWKEHKPNREKEKIGLAGCHVDSESRTFRLICRKISASHKIHVLGHRCLDHCCHRRPSLSL